MAATLTAQTRDGRGKNAARALRRTGRIPAVVYGHGEETRALSVDAHELEKLLTAISVENTIVDLTVGDGAPTPALIREVQHHPFKPFILHVDLYQIHAGETLTLQIPIRLSGNPFGVREKGGVLDQVLYDVEVECLPRNIPEAIEIDVTNLDIGDSLRVRDINIADVEILLDDDLPICSVTAPTKSIEEEEAEAEIEAAEGIEDLLEPELVGDEDAEADDTPATEQG
jgi:large subunit ribosomal protein L25